MPEALLVGAPISIDTYKSTVARAALDAGADIVNDVSALRFDAAMAPILAAEKVPVILMHMQGTPQTMQQDPRYADVVLEVRDFLAEQMYEAMDAGVRIPNVNDSFAGRAPDLKVNAKSSADSLVNLPEISP